MYTRTHTGLKLYRSVNKDTYLEIVLLSNGSGKICNLPFRLLFSRRVLNEIFVMKFEEKGLLKYLSELWVAIDCNVFEILILC